MVIYIYNSTENLTVFKNEKKLYQRGKVNLVLMNRNTLHGTH